LEIDVAAEADAKNPANVIPTCIVAKNPLASLSKFNNNFAFLLFSSANKFNFVLFIDTIAISANAKNAFTITSIRIRIILPPELSSIKKIPPKNMMRIL